MKMALVTAHMNLICEDWAGQRERYGKCPPFLSVTLRATDANGGSTRFRAICSKLGLLREPYPGSTLSSGSDFELVCGFAILITFLLFVVGR